MSTIEQLRRRLFALSLSLVPLLLCRHTSAAALTSGDIVVAYGTNLAEYTPAGALVQTFTPANAPDGYNTWEGVTVTGDGNLHVLNQEFNNYLTTYDPSSGATQTDSLSGMNIAGVGYFGNIGADAANVYVPDYSTGPGDPEGIVRFPLNALSSPSRFATNINPYAVTVGLNGMIYAVDSGTSVTEWDPATLTEVGSYSLTQVTGDTEYAIEDVAVAANGDLYTINEASQVYAYDAAGNLMSEAQVDGANTSIDLLADGELVLGSTGNTVTFTSTSDLSHSTSFNFPGVGTVFAAVVVPEPPLGGVLVLNAFALAVHRRRKDLSTPIAFAGRATRCET